MKPESELTNAEWLRKCWEAEELGIIRIAGLEQDLRDSKKRLSEARSGITYYLRRAMTGHGEELPE